MNRLLEWLLIGGLFAFAMISCLTIARQQKTINDYEKIIKDYETTIKQAQFKILENLTEPFKKYIEESQKDINSIQIKAVKEVATNGQS